MPQVDFTLEDLKQVFATKDDLRNFGTKDELSAMRDDIKRLPTRDDVLSIVHEEFVKFEPKVKRIVRFEIVEAEARIKTEIKHYVDAEHQDLKARLGRFGQAAASLLSSEP